MHANTASRSCGKWAGQGLNMNVCSVTCMYREPGMQYCKHVDICIDQTVLNVKQPVVLALVQLS